MPEALQAKRCCIEKACNLHATVGWPQGKWSWVLLLHKKTTGFCNVNKWKSSISIMSMPKSSTDYMSIDIHNGDSDTPNYRFIHVSWTFCSLFSNNCVYLILIYLYSPQSITVTRIASFLSSTFLRIHDLLTSCKDTE